ncbi:hypothetical protein ACFW0H_16435 [Pseudomonas sp. CR3202]|uniref:hypothetical protein n=1 Tax=Pseudomonas sp. CR3202 TaxID=3351532 RepID=UPI003BF32CE3
MGLTTKQSLGHWLALALVVSSPSTLIACKKREPSPEQVAYQQQQERCRMELVKSEKVPIIGGGYVDMSRFGYPGSSVRYEDGQCGSDMLQLLFWWTGEEILPDSPKYIKRKRTEIPKSWQIYNVAAVLGNQRKARECKENIELPKCSGFKGAVQTGLSKAEWPAELTVKLKNYPGLELWLNAPPPSIRNRYAVDNFVMTEWRRQDGTPRSINCWGLNTSSLKKSGLNSESLALLSREELENIDFQGRLQHGVSCQVEFWDFGFNAGSARISFSTENLREAHLALKAINQYLSDSIIMEE